MDNNAALGKLRSLMENESIDTYIVTKSDPHQTEYVEDHWNAVKFISNFTGSAGTAVLTATHAGLWTDGRYYLQAQNELSEHFTLHRASDTGVRGFLDYAAEETPPGGAIGFSGDAFSCSQVKSLSKKIKNKNINIKTGADLVASIWENRPALSCKPAYIHETRFNGMASRDKLRLVREKMDKAGADYYLLSSLDDIAWLTNLRGNDIPRAGLFAAYVLIDGNNGRLFIDPQKIQHINLNGFETAGYGEIYNYVQDLPRGKTIAYCPAKTSCGLAAAAEGMEIVELAADFTAELKAVKNETEIKNLKNANIRDSVSFTRFIKWVKERGAKTEFEAAEKLREHRLNNKFYIMDSFPAIAGYMKNGAVIHYNTNLANAVFIKPEGFLLVDSGGQYLDGTTDITRTISLGHLTDEMKKHYTLVLKGHIRLARAVFPYGTTGHQLDVLAREALWLNGLEYKHGTGHGIGFSLSVHEGPHSIAAKPNDIKLEAGMTVSNEPGLYLEGRYGIRTENTVLVKKHADTEFGTFLCFETISFVPFDLDALDTDILSIDELIWLNNYHKMVFDTISPHLTGEERLWLAHETRPV